MTGGLVLVLGEVGNNFGAGMTGGIAIVFNDKTNLETKINNNFVEAIKLNSVKSFELDEIIIELLMQHMNLTNSHKAKIIVNEFHRLKDSFYIVKSYNSDLFEQINHEAALIHQQKA